MDTVLFSAKVIPAGRPERHMNPITPVLSAARRSFTRSAIVAGLVASAATVSHGLAAEGDPPFHSLVGQRFVPNDVDWQHPVYETAFNNPSALQDWRLEGGK